MQLSRAARSAWGKSDRQTDQSLPLYQHMLDSSEIAGHLWDHWLPDTVRAAIGAALPGGEADGRVLYQWAAGLHDVGKASPAFAVQMPALADRMVDAGLPMPPAIPHAERSKLPHSLASYLAIERWLMDLGWDKTAARAFASIAGSHHGVTPSLPRTPPDRMLGKGQWQKTRGELLQLVTDHVGATPRLQAWSTTTLPLPVQVLLCGAVIVADWLASNADSFPLGEHRDTTEHARAAWADLRFPPPWRPEMPDTSTVFRSRFTLPGSAELRQVQAAALRVATALAEPGIMVVEAPMGGGKTEAALMAAEVLAARFGAGGVFFALPTRATSNGIFPRMRSWLERLPADVDNPATSMYLAHSKAALNRDFTDLLNKGRLHSIMDECGGASAVAVAHSWMSGRKRGVLANFVVGTIDQLLFTALRSRHLMLRHLAFAGKVVIVDEVHAADAYMRHYLERALAWLGAYSVPVVMLSATLPAAQRRSLIAAYRGIPADDVSLEAIGEARDYPLISYSAGPDTVALPVEDTSTPITVAIQRLGDELPELVALLETSLQDGGCAAVIRNTVVRAQDTAEALQAAFPAAEVMLVHSRFVEPDRATLEARLRAALGPISDQRPRRLIVVGTQVIEQSLDIDFDLMVTDLAPVDLILQRIGRLHRHRRQRPRGLESPVCYVTGVVDWHAEPPAPVRGSVAVYGQLHLARALAVLAPRWATGQITIPNDVAPLVQHAYAEDFPWPPGWEAVGAEAEANHRRFVEGQIHKATNFLLGLPDDRPDLVGWLDSSAGEADDAQGQAQVRDTDASLEVVVVQRIDGQVRLLPDRPGTLGPVIPTEFPPENAVAKRAATYTITLPQGLTKPWRMNSTISSLERTFYPGWQASRWLEGQLVLELDASLSATIGDTMLTYDRVRGLLTHTKPKEAR